MQEESISPMVDLTQANTNTWILLEYQIRMNPIVLIKRNNITHGMMQQSKSMDKL